MNDNIKGILLLVSSNLLFCLMSGILKYVGSAIDPFKTVLFRFIIGLGLLGLAALFRKVELKFHHSPYLFCRGFFGGLATFIFFLSISKLGIAKGTIITSTYPIFATILAAIVLKEKITIITVISIVAAFVGIFLIATDKGDVSILSGIGIYEIIALLGAFFSGLAVLFVKLLHDTDSSYSIFFSQCLVGLWIVVIPANLVPCEIGYWGGVMLLLIGITAAVGQLLMTEGYKYTNLTTGALLSMLLPVMNIFLGFFVFQERINLKIIIGSVIVLVSCAVVILAKRQPQNTESVNSPVNE